MSSEPVGIQSLENILIPCMPLAPHVIDTKKYTYMPLSGTQGMSVKSDGIPGIFSSLCWSHVATLLRIRDSARQSNEPLTVFYCRVAAAAAPTASQKAATSGSDLEAPGIGGQAELLPESQYASGVRIRGARLSCSRGLLSSTRLGRDRERGRASCVDGIGVPGER
jgi:hypothetical protein